MPLLLCAFECSPCSIGVFAAVEDNRLRLRVQDNGCGVRTGTQRLIFDAFLRLKMMVTVGLFWQRQFWTGKVAHWIESSTENDGSVFMVSCPWTESLNEFTSTAKALVAGETACHVVRESADHRAGGSCVREVRWMVSRSRSMCVSVVRMT